MTCEALISRRVWAVGGSISSATLIVHVEYVYLACNATSLC